jgi:hypothetical protein
LISDRHRWRTFLSNHVDGIAAIDLFVLPTIAFQILYCLVIVRRGRRLWASFGVTANPTAELISRQVTKAFPWDHAPRYLIAAYYNVSKTHRSLNKDAPPHRAIERLGAVVSRPVLRPSSESDFRHTQRPCLSFRYAQVASVIGNRHDHALTLRRTFILQEHSHRRRRSE